MRWGLMTFLVWLPYRTMQKREGKVRAGYYVAAIAISAIVFGLGHLPLARVLSPTVTAPLVAYVIIGNALCGLVAGYLYWRRGLESAMIAHMMAYVVMLTAERWASGPCCPSSAHMRLSRAAREATVCFPVHPVVGPDCTERTYRMWPILATQLPLPRPPAPYEFSGITIAEMRLFGEDASTRADRGCISGASGTEDLASRII